MWGAKRATNVRAGRTAIGQAARNRVRPRPGGVWLPLTSVKFALEAKLAESERVASLRPHTGNIRRSYSSCAIARSPEKQRSLACPPGVQGSGRPRDPSRFPVTSYYRAARRKDCSWADHASRQPDLRVRRQARLRASPQARPAVWPCSTVTSNPALKRDVSSAQAGPKAWNSMARSAKSLHKIE
jgi:hypothetical protein